MFGPCRYISLGPISIGLYACVSRFFSVCCCLNSIRFARLCIYRTGCFLIRILRGFSVCFFFFFFSEHPSLLRKVLCNAEILRLFASCTITSCKSFRNESVGRNTVGRNTTPRRVHTTPPTFFVDLYKNRPKIIIATCLLDFLLAAMPPRLTVGQLARDELDGFEVLASEVLKEHRP